MSPLAISARKSSSGAGLSPKVSSVSDESTMNGR